MAYQKTLNGDTGPSDDQMRLWRFARETLGMTRTEAYENFPETMSNDDARGWRYIGEDVQEHDLTIDYDTVNDPINFAYWLSEALNNDNDDPVQFAIDYEGLEELPYRVATACQPTAEWEDSRLDPTDVHKTECACCGEDLWNVLATEPCFITGEHDTYVNDWGDVMGHEYVGDPSSFIYDTDPDTSGIMCGGCYENHSYGGSTVVVTDGDEKYKATILGSIVKNYECWETPEHVRELFDKVAQGESTIQIDGWRSAQRSDTPDEFVNVADGWHSTLERSEFSDKLNDLTNRNEIFHFPIVTYFGTTTNVCSTTISVYVPADKEQEVRDYFEGVRGFGMKT